MYIGKVLARRDRKSERVTKIKIKRERERESEDMKYLK